ncbi:MAG: ATP-binding protein [Bacteroidales bacterium]|nr:ATP-binding protein [Bacteroidales bacterium]
MWHNIQVKRNISHLLPSSEERLILLITGSRQTGKTTLLKSSYPDLPYFNLDSIEYREQLRSVSSFAWGKVAGNAIIDEIQKEPQLFDKLKFAFDEKAIHFSALSGSAQVHLLTKVRETLAGRIMILELFPFMLSELISPNEEKRPDILIDRLIGCRDADLLLDKINPVLLGEKWDKAKRAEEYLLKWGGMPPLIHIKDDGRKQLWLKDFTITFLERDLGDLARIYDLLPFRKLQQLLALRSACILSYSDLARDAGIGVQTARRYLEYLILSYQTFLLSPYSENLTSSIIKSPKVYWTDNGLLRSISGLGFEITNGQLYENYFASEMMKFLRTYRKNETMSFYRTRSGMEVDFCLNTRQGLIAMEVKYRDNVDRSDFTSLRKLKEAAGKKWFCGLVIYTGNEIKKFEETIWAIPSSRLFSA